MRATMGYFDGRSDVCIATNSPRVPLHSLVSEMSFIIVFLDLSLSTWRAFSSGHTILQVLIDASEEECKVLALVMALFSDDRMVYPVSLRFRVGRDASCHPVICIAGSSYLFRRETTHVYYRHCMVAQLGF